MVVYLLLKLTELALPLVCPWGEDIGGVFAAASDRNSHP